jgi:hypothetical protein
MTGRETLIERNPHKQRVLSTCLVKGDDVVVQEQGDSTEGKKVRTG